MQDEHVVGVLIVGAGQAAAELAVALRQEGYSGDVWVVGEEASLPYQRPPLSKAYLAGTLSAEALLIRAQQAWNQARVEFRLGQAVVHIDPAAKRVRLADGSVIHYAKLALATGGRARQLALPGRELRGIHSLRSLTDVNGIRPALQAGRRLVIVGGGYVGLEVAAIAVRAGLQVTVLESASRVLARVTAPQISEFYQQLHEGNGVQIFTGMQVCGFAPGDCPVGVGAVLCQDGTRFDADVVIVGVGLIANVELAEAAGLAVDNGIVIDAMGQTSDPDIVAVGDCTTQYSALYGRSLRLESVPSAIEQARCAAALLCEKPRRNETVPWFWSDQYGLKLQMVGLSQGYEQLVIRGAVEQHSFAAFYLVGECLIAADVVGRPADFMAAKRLIAEQVPVTAAALADETQPLKSLLTLPAAG